MPLSEPISAQVEALVYPIIEGMGYEIVEMSLLGQGRRRTFQILVDKPEGISIEDCADISRNLSRLLDVEDPFPFEYTLEVGSPGIYRELKTDKDLERYLGYRVKVKLIEPLFESYTRLGQIIRSDKDIVVLDDEAGDVGQLEIKRANIKRLSLEPKL